MEVATAAGQSYATVTWQVPVATDNSNETLNLSGLLPPQQLNVGGTSIRYVVTDSAGISSSCVFSIQVKDLEPPKIYHCPVDIKIISLVRWHKLVLPGVAVTDNVGVKLFKTNPQNGSEVTWGEYNITYTALDKAGNHAYCRFLITIADSPCEELPPPKNGAKACETWMAGLMCTVHCNDGYGFATEWIQPVYYCLPDGKWRNTKDSKNPALPDCSKTHVPKSALMNGQYHYLTKKCGDEQMNEEIAGYFIDLLMGTTFGQAGACKDNQHCIIENVKVECGTTARRRRDAIGDKRNATVPLTVSFSIKIPLNVHSNASLDLNQTSQQISNDVLAALEKVDMTLNVSGVVIQADPSKPPEIRLTRLVCEEGQVQIGAMCVNCPPGYFFNGTSCQACAVDQYQDKEAQTSCISCPSWTSTAEKQGSKRSQDCQDLPSDVAGKSKDQLPKGILIAVLTVGAFLLIALVIGGIVCVRKHCPGDKRRADSPVGFSNDGYCDADSVLRLQDMQSSNA